MKKCNALDWICGILVIVGAINWGLVGVADLNLVELVLGSMPVVVKVVYILVGLSGLYAIYMASKCGGSCNK